MLILASLSGIQDFLFDIREAGGGQARSLRHRSFRIQLMAEVLALRLLEAAGLPYDRLVFCAAAKVCIDATGIAAPALARLHQTVADLERQLLDQTHGRLRLAVVVQEPQCDPAATFDQAHRALACRKLRAWAPGETLAAGLHGASQGGACGARWPAAGLVIRQRWDSDAEADRDAELGRQLASARWLSIRRAHGDGPGPMDVFGLRIHLEPDEPTGGPNLISCSNLQQPDRPPVGIDRERFHPRRLARHIPRDERGDPIEFVDLAARSCGAPMLGVLKADADSLGRAVFDTLTGSNGGAVALRRLSRALDGFFGEKLQAEMYAPESSGRSGHSGRWELIYTVFAGGDDMLLVGPWDLMLEFAGHMRQLFDREFGGQAPQRVCPRPLTISAGVAIVKPRYPVHLAAQQAEELLEHAKTASAGPGAEPKDRCAALGRRGRARAPLREDGAEPKDRCAALGQVWKWRDHEAIITAGRQLAGWVRDDIVQRGWLHTLLELASLRRGDGGAKYERLPPAVATSRLVYHVARNWPHAGGHGDPRSAARQWIDEIVRHFDRGFETGPVAVRYLPAILRYAILATRSGSQEDRQ